MNVGEALRKLEREGPAGVYLVTGSETYLRRGFLERLETAVLGEDHPLGRQVVEASGLALAEVETELKTVPLFGERRLVVLRDWSPLSGGRSVDTDPGKALERILAGLPAETCLVFDSTSVDRRTAVTRMLERAAVTVQCEPLKVKDAVSWLTRRARERGHRLTGTAAAMLGELVGPDLQRLERELDKVLLYAGDEDPVEPRHVQAVASGEGQWRIFDVQDAIGEGRPAGALEALRRLFDMGEPPLRALTMIARHMRLLWQVGVLQDRGLGRDAIRKELGVHPFVVGKCLTQARRFRPEDLRRGLEACHETDVAIKTGTRPADVAVELLVVKLAGWAAPDSPTVPGRSSRTLPGRGLG